MATRVEVISAVIAFICMVLTAVATFFTYVGSPMYVGNRPRLIYKTASSISPPTTFSFSVHLRNLSSAPARDVRVLLNLNGASGISFRSDTNFSERDGLSGQKLLILDLVPSNSEVTITADYSAAINEHEGMSVHMILNEFGEVSLPSE